MTDEIHNLLKTGADAYPDGLRAMARFRREIYLGARRSLTRNLEKLAAATRLELKAGDIKPHCWPDDFSQETDWDGLLAVVGAKLTVLNRTHIYARMWWNSDTSDDDTPLAVGVSFEPWFVPWRRKIIAAAHQIEGDLAREDEAEVWLQEDVSSGNIRDFEGLFDRIFFRWQPIFGKLDGFPTQRPR